MSLKFELSLMCINIIFLLKHWMKNVVLEIIYVLLSLASKKNFLPGKFEPEKKFPLYLNLDIF